MVPCYESIGIFSSLGEIRCNYAETRRQKVRCGCSWESRIEIIMI